MAPQNQVPQVPEMIYIKCHGGQAHQKMYSLGRFICYVQVNTYSFGAGTSQVTDSVDPGSVDPITSIRVLSLLVLLLLLVLSLLLCTSDLINWPPA